MVSVAASERSSWAGAGAHARNFLNAVASAGSTGFCDPLPAALPEVPA